MKQGQEPTGAAFSHTTAPLQTDMTNRELVETFYQEARPDLELKELAASMDALRARIASLPRVGDAKDPPGMVSDGSPANIAAHTELNRQMSELFIRDQALKATVRVKEVHKGTALCLDDSENGDVSVYAAGSDTAEEGRRSLVFRDDRPNGGWSVRLRYRADVRMQGRARDPGTFDRPSRDQCILIAKDWVVSAAVPRK